VSDSYYDTLTLQLTKQLPSGSEDWLFISYLKDAFKGGSFYGLDNYLKSKRVAVFSYPIPDRYGTISDEGDIKISNLIMEGNNYQDVLRFVTRSGTDTTASYYYKAEYYWAKGIGVIKRTLTNANGRNTWTLLRMGK